MDNLIDTTDMEILMHRDVHFSGSFESMLEYYESEGVGIVPDFETEEIRKLQKLEQEEGKNLSEHLPEEAKEQVEKAKRLYQDLREVYSDEKTPPESLLLSDLILSEEELPEKEIAAIARQGKSMVPALIDLLSSPTFYDPLYPGYGRSPIFAAKCLAKIGDERAIPPLFEALGQDNFFTDEEMIYALTSFGEKSKAFLIQRLKQEPFSKDNEYAAIALTGFTDDPEIGRTALEVLEKEEVFKNPLFATYLVFACADLSEEVEKERFIAVTKKKGLPQNLLDEMMIVIKNWKKSS